MSGPNADGYKDAMPEAVIIVWQEGENFCTLAYNNGNGPIRVYPRDRYDARLDLGRGEPLMFCGNVEQAKAFMAGRGKDTACQIPVRIAGAFGFYRAAMDQDALAILPEYNNDSASKCDK